jgi:acyl-coenzyme A synthetase/AMP-(fatty) acid ligase
MRSPVSQYRPVVHQADAIVALGDEAPRTAGMLARDVLAVAARLPPASPGSEVLIVCGDRYRVAVAVLAAWQAGHAAALPPNAASETVRALRRRPAVVALLHDTDADDADDLRPWLVASDPAIDPAQLRPIASDRVIAIVYTSGSSGAHQACPKTARQLLGEALTLAERFAVGPAQRVLSTVPPHHLYGLLFGVLVPLCAGASFIRETPLHTETVAAVARRLAADMLVSAPVHLRSLTLLSPGELPPLARVFSSGAALPPETARLLGTRLGLWVTEIYGASETGGIAWRRHAPGKPAGDLPWEPLPGISVAADEGGGLLLSSPFLPPDAATPLACADQIDLAADGRFRLLGRRDDVLKIGGKRVALAELEQRALALPEVADVAVAMLTVGEPRGHEIVAAIVPTDPRHDPAALIAHVRHGLLQWFDPVVVPRRIRVVPTLPREASGKLTRANLLRLFERPVAKDSPKPRTVMTPPTPRPQTALEAMADAQRIAFAPFIFQAACVMRDRGILAAIDRSPGGLTLEEVAAAVALPIYGARVLLEAGLGIGIVVEVERRYRLTKTAQFLLHDPMTRANMDFTRDVNYAGLAHLGEAVATGKPAGLKVFGEWDTVYQALAHLPEFVRESWFGFDHHYSDGAFGAALPLVFRDRPRRILDIGGNTGKWATLCLRHDPDVALTLMDLPGQLRNAEDSLRGAGLLERVRFHEANLLDPACEVPGDHDVIWMSQFLDCFSEPEIVSILRRCAAALAPGAAIYILEAFWDRQRFPAASFCLQMTSLYFTAIANGNSQMYRSDTFLACVREAGLEIEQQHDNLGVSHTLLVCRRAR